MTPPPMKTTSDGREVSDSTSSEVIISSAPGIGSGRVFDPVAMTMWAALQRVVADPDGVRPGEGGAAGEHGAALFRDALHGGGDMGDDPGLARDKRRPVQLCWADRDPVHLGAFDLVQRMGGGDQHLLRCAAAVGADAAEIAFLDEGDGFPGRMGDLGHPEAGIAAADDDDVECRVHGCGSFADRVRQDLGMPVAAWIRLMLTLPSEAGRTAAMRPAKSRRQHPLIRPALSNRRIDGRGPDVQVGVTGTLQ